MNCAMGDSDETQPIDTEDPAQHEARANHSKIHIQPHTRVITAQRECCSSALRTLQNSRLQNKHTEAKRKNRHVTRSRGTSTINGSPPCGFPGRNGFPSFETSRDGAGYPVPLMIPSGIVALQKAKVPGLKCCQRTNLELT